MAGRYDFFSGIRVVCGSCGDRQVFDGGYQSFDVAKTAGWLIENRPQQHVLCPDCLEKLAKPIGGTNVGGPRLLYIVIQRLTSYGFQFW